MKITKFIFKTALKKNILKKDVFDQEITICKNLSKENGGKCNWGECSKCGVLPLLYKLHTGILLENQDEIKKIKDKVLL